MDAVSAKATSPILGACVDAFSSSKLSLRNLASDVIGFYELNNMKEVLLLYLALGFANQISYNAVMLIAEMPAEIRTPPGPLQETTIISNLRVRSASL